MMRPPRGALCDRARSWAALAPDGELSELERKLLQAHLVRCGECRAFADDVAAVTDALHRETLVPLPQPVSIASWRRRGAVYGRVRAVGAAAAVALMAVGIATRAPLPSDDRAVLDLPRVTNFSNDADPDFELAQILRAQGAGLDEAGLQPGAQGVRQTL